MARIALGRVTVHTRDGLKRRTERDSSSATCRPTVARLVPGRQTAVQPGNAALTGLHKPGEVEDVSLCWQPEPYTSRGACGDQSPIA